MLVTCIFIFSYNVFQRPIHQGCENMELFCLIIRTVKKLINLSYSIKCHFKHNFNYFTEASAPIQAFLQLLFKKKSTQYFLFTSIPCKIFFSPVFHTIFSLHQYSTQYFLFTSIPRNIFFLQVFHAIFSFYRYSTEYFSKQLAAFPQPLTKQRTAVGEE